MLYLSKWRVWTKETAAEPDELTADTAEDAALYWCRVHDRLRDEPHDRLCSEQNPEPITVYVLPVYANPAVDPNDELRIIYVRAWLEPSYEVARSRTGAF